MRRWNGYHLVEVPDYVDPGEYWLRPSFECQDCGREYSDAVWEIHRQRTRHIGRQITNSEKEAA